MRTVHVIITGRVQGVGYRDWCERAALVRALNGWVRNRDDGSVEALFCGDDEEVEDMIAACQRGPAAAAVANVVVTPSAELPRRFTILPTA
ncbi:MAG TPA: acylphosphatase [Devosiaceae bacterium]|jgi:acylphosphatase